MSGDGDDLIAESQEGWIVAYGEGRTAFLVADPQQGECHALCALLIEGRGRLVKEQKGLVQSQSCSQEEALALTAREFGSREFQQAGLQPQRLHDGCQGVAAIQRDINLQSVGQANEVCTCGCRGLQFLGNIGHLPADGCNMMDIQREPTNLYRPCRQRHKAHQGTQQRCLAATALSREANELTPAHIEVEVTKEYAVAKGDGSRADGNHQLAAVNSSRKRTSFSEKRRRSFT